MNLNNCFLLIGGCGSGKTWTMKSIIKNKNLDVLGKCGMVYFKTNKQEDVCVLGKYDGSVFEGSDKLSMAVARDFELFKKLSDVKKWKIICEGDRFTNKKFIDVFKPYVIKIKDSGEKGRKLRKSTQTERHIKSIQTRVNNTKYNIEVENSSEALKTLLNLT